MTIEAVTVSVVLMVMRIVMTVIIVLVALGEDVVTQMVIAIVTM